MTNSEGNANKCFLVYYDNEVIVCRLPDEEAGRLFKSLFPYGRESIKPNFEDNPALAMAFDILSMAIDRGKEKYAERCEKNRKNISKRWNAEDTTVYDRIQSNTKDTTVYDRIQSNTKDTTVYDRVPYKEKYKEKEKYKNKKKDKDINTISSEPETAPSSQSGILILLNDKSSYDVPLDKIALWKETYPAVDVEQELRKMVAWSHSNPTRRKTRRGVNRFINSWLAREQDRGGSRTTREKEQAQTDEEYYAPYREMYANMKTTTDGPFQ